MKNLKFLTINVLLLGFMLFSLSSCEKDEDKKEVIKAEIVGEWTITNGTLSLTVDGKNYVQYLMDEWGFTQEEIDEMVDTDITGTFDINSDGTYLTTVDGDEFPGTWEWGSGNAIILDEGTEDEVTMQVEELTSSKLVMSYSDEYEEDWNFDEDPETIVETVRMECSK
ncbi:MAG: hypothetical protein IPM71_03470 [Bacteroidota bacterium]|nr:MAG: hypothetical protein IPM71_03470 [Bacteroidota bacterium]